MGMHGGIGGTAIFFVWNTGVEDRLGMMQPGKLELLGPGNSATLTLIQQGLHTLSSGPQLYAFTCCSHS
jgi:hypothetical protein